MLLAGLSCISADLGLIHPIQRDTTVPAQHRPSLLGSTSHALIRLFVHGHMEKFLGQELVRATLQSPVLQVSNSTFGQGFSKDCKAGNTFLRNQHDSAWLDTNNSFVFINVTISHHRHFQAPCDYFVSSATQFTGTAKGKKVPPRPDEQGFHMTQVGCVHPDMCRQTWACSACA